MVCVHSALKSNEPDICAIKGGKQILFLGKFLRTAEVTITEQNVTVVSIGIFFNSLPILFLQLPKDRISARLKTNTSENTENTFIFTHHYSRGIASLMVAVSPH